MAMFDFLNLGKTEATSTLPGVPSTNSMDFDASKFNQVNTSSIDPGASLTTSLDQPAFTFGATSTPSLSLPATSGASWWDKAIGSTDPVTGKTTGGFATPAIGALSAGLNFYTGQQQLGLAEDQLKTSKQQFADQFNLQKQQVNMDIQDQGQARYDRNPNLNVTPEEYYNKNKIA